MDAAFGDDRLAETGAAFHFFGAAPGAGEHYGDVEIGVGARVAAGVGTEEDEAEHAVAVDFKGVLVEGFKGTAYFCWYGVHGAGICVLL